MQIPVTLITGFLGAGKTTLLNRLLKQPALSDSAVIINEVGSVGLDQRLAKSLVQYVESPHISENMRLLESGCLCCSLNNELADTMRDLFFKRALGGIPAFNRLIIETTGMADPVPIMAHLLNEPVIQSVYRLAQVVVVVDAQYMQQQVAQFREAWRQIASADILLISKTDLIPSSQLDEVLQLLQQINPQAEIANLLHGNIEAEYLFAQTHKLTHKTTYRTSADPQKAFISSHGEQVNHFTIHLPQPLNYQRLQAKLLWLCDSYAEQLLRLKGIVMAEDLTGPIALHAVHNTLFPPTPLDVVDDTVPNLLVLIGVDLDEAEIRKQMMQI